MEPDPVLPLQAYPHTPSDTPDATAKLEGVLNEFWETSGRPYKILVFSAMGATAVGLVLTIIGANAHDSSRTYLGLPFIGLGLILHMVGLVVRGQYVRKLLRRK